MFMTKLLPLLLFLLSLLFQCNLVLVSGEIRCIQREREALLEFKRAFVNAEVYLFDWGSEDEKKECCNWGGVECSNTTGHVIHLETPFELRGEVSPALLELHHLTVLNLGSNDFGGSNIPNFMGSMKTLRYLSFFESNLSGIVPQHLGNLTNLETLDLSGNLLRFVNLNWLSHLSSLSDLDLSGNNISDINWPQHISTLYSLKGLRMDGCQLTVGTLSKGIVMNSSSLSLSSIDLSNNHVTLLTLDWLLNIRSLVHLDMSSNWLDGLVPNSFKNLTSLETLYLSNNKLRGKISQSLENLSYLKFLDLSHNELNEQFSESIGNLSCKALRDLLLNDNQFSGSVPDLSSCITLRYLDLGSNKLEELPTSFAQLSELKELNVSSNSLKGTVSTPTFMKLHNLMSLDLSSNAALHIPSDWNPPIQLEELLLRDVNLGPEFPTWIQVLRNLSILDLSYTGISDKFPDWFWNFSTSLNSVQLSQNNIHGKLPDIHLEDLRFVDVSANGITGPLRLFGTTMIVLQLSQNRFSGSLKIVCNMSELRFLDVSYNQLSGELPNCWRNMSYDLRVLDLSNNNFSSGIPVSLGSLQNLIRLHLSNNSFTGELPSTLKNCQALMLMDVGGNELTQVIPKWIGSTYTNLKFLIFRHNKFYGNIPEEICNITGIQVLNLSLNNLSGKVPKCLYRFSSLIEGNMTAEAGVIYEGYEYYEPHNNYPHISVQWKMEESKYQEILGFLKLIDLSNNKLIGNIPPQLFQLKGLLSLNLSRNNLEGSIPSNIGNMENLESLDLSRNHLSGPIPDSLTKLHFLGTLYLSRNNLSGKIPTGTQLQSFNESSYDGNPQLCGQPLALCPKDDPNSPPSMPEENDVDRNWFMSLSFGEDLCISMAFGFIFGFWGLIGSLIVKRSWRMVYFNFFSNIGYWIYMKISVFLTKSRPR